MADKLRNDPQAPFATRIDPSSESLTPEQRLLIRRVELEMARRRAQKLRGKNIMTGLAIGAAVLGIYGYTFFSMPQEKIVDDLDKEAEQMRNRFPKTGAN